MAPARVGGECKRCLQHRASYNEPRRLFVDSRGVVVAAAARRTLESVIRTCKNCGTTMSSHWNRVGLCRMCNDYERRHKQPRPKPQPHFDFGGVGAASVGDPAAHGAPAAPGTPRVPLSTMLRRKCVNCNTSDSFRWIHGRCHGCYEYRQRHGCERPARLYSRNRGILEYRGNETERGWDSCGNCGNADAPVVANRQCKACWEYFLAHGLTRPLARGEDNSTAIMHIVALSETEALVFPRRCLSCGTSEADSWARNLCKSCYDYGKRSGKPRPAKLFGRRNPAKGITDVRRKLCVYCRKTAGLASQKSLCAACWAFYKEHGCAPPLDHSPSASAAAAATTATTTAAADAAAATGAAATDGDATDDATDDDELQPEPQKPGMWDSEPFSLCSCANCFVLSSSSFSQGICKACYDFRRIHHVDRPLQLWPHVALTPDGGVLVHLEEPRVCENCSTRTATQWVSNKCYACHEFERRHGLPRPPRLFAHKRARGKRAAERAAPAAKRAKRSSSSAE